MKRVLALMLSAVLCFQLTSCMLSPKSYTIDLIVKGTETEFWKSVNEGAQAAASIYHVGVTMRGPEVEKDYYNQIEYIKQSIARKPDAIILAASDYNMMADQVGNAVSAGIPVVMVDSDVNSKLTVAYVGTDNIKIGGQLAKELCSRMKNGGKVAIISFVQYSYPAVQREAGFREAMTSDARFKLLETKYCYSDIETAKQLTENLLKTQPDIVAVAALNAQSATGAAEAISETGRKDVHLFGVDCTPDEAMYMEDNILDVALIQNPYQMGYYSVEAAVQHLNGHTVKNIYTDIYAVDKSTLFDDLYQQLIFPFSS